MHFHPFDYLKPLHRVLTPSSLCLFVCGSVVLLVVDEAHRAKGKHAFATVTQAIRQENPYLRVLGKT